MTEATYQSTQHKLSDICTKGTAMQCHSPQKSVKSTLWGTGELGDSVKEAHWVVATILLIER